MTDRRPVFTVPPLQFNPLNFSQPVFWHMFQHSLHTLTITGQVGECPPYTPAQDGDPYFFPFFLPDFESSSLTTRSLPRVYPLRCPSPDPSTTVSVEMRTELTRGLVTRIQCLIQRSPLMGSVTRRGLW